MSSNHIIFVLISLAFFIGICRPKEQRSGSAYRYRSSNATFKENPYWTGKKLLLVHLLFRHGNRTNIHTYPNDPYINETFQPYGWGQLTNEGKQTMYEIGTWLKIRYGNFLGEYYKPNVIWAQSTWVVRTVMSLQLVLAGLFPPKDTPMNWNYNLNWQPIPVFSAPIDEDKLFIVCPCQQYNVEFFKNCQQSHYQQIIDKNQQIFDELTNLTGKRINSLIDIQQLYDTLLTQSEYHLKLPDWTKNYFPDRLESLTKQSYLYYSYNDELKRIKGGPFIKKLINDWKQKRNGTLLPKGRKMFAYCAHDTTITNVLSAIGVWEMEMPHYGIMIIFEFLKNVRTGEYGIQLFLKNISSNLIQLIVPGCGHFCPLDQFIELTKNVIPNDSSCVCRLKVKRLRP